MAGPAVAFIVKGYPRLSETFIAQEIRGLEQRGLDIRIVSLRHPTDRLQHPVHDEIAAPVLYLPEYLYREPFRVWRGWRTSRTRPGYRATRRAWFRDLWRDPTPNRVRRFGQALVLASELPDDVARLHAHFIHTPASVARYTALLSDRVWTCSAHAKDVWTTPGWEVAEKIAGCSWAVTCSAAARGRLGELVPDAGKIELIYHGLDATRFPPTAVRSPMRDGRDALDPVIILAVGRMVEKKGFDVLIDALALLPAPLAWHVVHVGGGPLRAQLMRHAKKRGIERRITWQGPLPQKDLLATYRKADLFVLPSRIAGNGDRDGLPNVLLEAQSQGLVCIASRVSGVPELIDDGSTGVLVEPEDPHALATAIEALALDPTNRLRLGQAGEAVVRSKFASDTALARLVKKFGIAADVERHAACV